MIPDWFLTASTNTIQDKTRNNLAILFFLILIKRRSTIWKKKKWLLLWRRNFIRRGRKDWRLWWLSRLSRLSRLSCIIWRNNRWWLEDRNSIDTLIWNRLIIEWWMKRRKGWIEGSRFRRSICIDWWNIFCTLMRKRSKQKYI